MRRGPETRFARDCLKGQQFALLENPPLRATGKSSLFPPLRRGSLLPQEAGALAPLCPAASSRPAPPGHDHTGLAGGVSQPALLFLLSTILVPSPRHERVRQHLRFAGRAILASSNACVSG